MNKTIIITREQAEDFRNSLEHEIEQMEDDGDEVLKPHIEKAEATIDRIHSQLNSNSIQEAWHKLGKKTFGIDASEGRKHHTAVELYDVITFLKTIGVEV